MDKIPNKIVLIIFLEGRTFHRERIERDTRVSYKYDDFTQNGTSVASVTREKHKIIKHRNLIPKICYKRIILDKPTIHAMCGSKSIMPKTFTQVFPNLAKTSKKIKLSSVWNGLSIANKLHCHFTEMMLDCKGINYEYEVID